jgi:hypothetical protein
MFDWIARFMDLIVSLVPRLVKVRATHMGIKWPFCGEPRPMKPGLRCVWPLVDEWDVIVIARQTDALPPQSLTLADGTAVAVSGLAIYSVSDIVAAYGKRNWDVTSTIQDLSMAAIASVVSSLIKEDLRNLKEINEGITAQVQEWAKEYGVKVESCQLVEISVARTVRHLGMQIINHPGT